MSSSNSHTPVLSRSCSSLPTQKEKEEVTVIFLFSKTADSLVRGMTVEASEERCEGLLGRKTLLTEGTWFELLLYQEFPHRQLSQEMIVGSLNLIVMSFASNQEIRNQGEASLLILQFSVKYFSWKPEGNLTLHQKLLERILQPLPHYYSAGLFYRKVIERKFSKRFFQFISLSVKWFPNGWWFLRCLDKVLHS